MSELDEKVADVLQSGSLLRSKERSDSIVFD